MHREEKVFMENIYNPEEMKNKYDHLPHGKAKMEAIREAASESDKNNDVPFMIYFREELCHESCFYGDNMDMMVVFPEILSIIDKYPDTPATYFDSDSYNDATDHILWVYKWVISNCSDFYQIPMKDCMDFFEDFKIRCTRYGYNLKPYYLTLHYFYEYIDKEKADKAFNKFMAIPRDSNSDCKACDRNAMIKYYLQKDDLKKAEELSRDIESFKLTCGGGKDAWLRMKISYIYHYLEKGDYENATELAHLVERNMDIGGRTEFHIWDEIVRCYSYTKPGRALRIYKKHWKDMHKENMRNPSDAFGMSKNLCIFFKVFEKETGRTSVRLGLDETFPFYNEEGCYKTDDLYLYYYNMAKDIAEKFDKRNGTGAVTEELETALAF